MRFTLSAFVLLLALAGCGPKVKVNPELSTLSPRAYALLPIEVPASVKRERADLLYTALIQALQSHGFQLLDEDVVKQVCSAPACPERAKLLSDYGIDALLMVHISGITRANALAGYYNAIDGTLFVVDKDNKELLKVSHTESERGGILFNSGQAFQALKTTFTNLETDSFPLLADRFADTLVEKLPQPSPAVQMSGPALEIRDVSVKPLGDSRFMICAAGTPKMWAYYHVGATRTNLRETEPGRYCGALFLERSVSADDAPVVELHSLFGTVKQKRIEDMALVECDPSGFLSRSGNELRFTPQCASGDRSCAINAAACRGSKTFVYAAGDAGGPYRRTAGPRTPPWSEKAPSDAKTYAVIAVNRAGIRSVPQILEAK